MRRFVDRPKLEEFMKRIGAEAKSPGVIYLTGGATALLLGIRDQTIDIDIKMDPEPKGAFEAIAKLKDDLQLNVELAAPDQFIPPLPGWKERSIPIGTYGKVEFKHYDLYSQTLAKIERGHRQDRYDVESLMASRFVGGAELQQLFEGIRSEFVRYPAVDAKELERRVGQLVNDSTEQ